MSCHHCGEHVPKESRLCPACGLEINKVEQQAEAQENAENYQAEKDTPNNHGLSEDQADVPKPLDLPQTRSNKQKRQTRSRTKPKKTFTAKLPIIIPIVSLLLTGGGLTAYYFQQEDINEQVLSFQASAEAAALEGDYASAEEVLTKAQNLRPNYTVLNQNLQEVNQADQIAAQLEEVSASIKVKKYEEAEEQLTAVNKALEQENGPLFEPFFKEAANKEVTITVGKIKKELDTLTTINDLAGKLTILDTLSSEEALAVKEQILTKIVQISSDQATAELDSKHFSEALAAIEKGLFFARDNKTLLSLRDKIEQEQTAFENAELERLEQAMEAAAAEELQNKTAAVEVSNVEASVDEYGDLYLNGTVTNVATKAISSVTVYYTVYDKEDAVVNEGSTMVYPSYLHPNEQGTFEDYISGINEDITVEIDNIEWYLE